MTFFVSLLPRDIANNKTLYAVFRAYKQHCNISSYKKIKSVAY